MQSGSWCRQGLYQGNLTPSTALTQPTSPQHVLALHPPTHPLTPPLSPVLSLLCVGASCTGCTRAHHSFGPSVWHLHLRAVPLLHLPEVQQGLCGASGSMEQAPDVQQQHSFWLFVLPRLQQQHTARHSAYTAPERARSYPASRVQQAVQDAGSCIRMCCMHKLVCAGPTTNSYCGHAACKQQQQQRQ